MPLAELILNNFKNKFHERLHQSQIGPFADDDQIIDCLEVLEVWRTSIWIHQLLKMAIVTL